MKPVIIFIIIISILLYGCKKFVDPGFPGTQLTEQAIFSTDRTAHSAQLGIYTAMETDAIAYDLLLATGKSGDELINYSNSNASVDLATNNLTADNPIVLSLWTDLYKYIYQANSVLNGIINSKNLSDATKNQLEGEAKFIRAFCHYYLVNLFGEIPIVTTTDFRISSIQQRNHVDEVYEAIENDLLDAIRLLKTDYINAFGQETEERVRPNKSAAQFLLARLNLIQEKWSEAETLSSEILDQVDIYSILDNLDNVFLKNSEESIWQLMSVVPRYNSSVGANTNLLSRPTVFAMDTLFVKSFRPDDNRFLSWINSITVAGVTYWYPYKYKVGQNASAISEYTTVMRLAEVYLIRAEARARQGNIEESIADLNIIRNRAGLPSLSNFNQTDLVDSIHQERRFELFTEFSDRWLDLNRTDKTDQVLGVLKGDNWSQTDNLYPIPQRERDRNINLSQNPGY